MRKPSSKEAVLPAIMNRRAESFEGADFYPTPRWATVALLAQEQFTGTIAEPCCGAGDMASVLVEKGLQVIASDLYDRGYGKTGIDARQIVGPFGSVVTNPPYNIAADLLPGFLNAATDKVALLLRMSFLESRRRYALFSAAPPSRVYVFSERLSLSKHGEIVKGGGTVSYAWFVWQHGWNGNPEIRWIPPGFKTK